MITSNVIDLIGNTPLIKLKYPSEISGCEIYGKAEFLNPGGSVKDRTALGIILDCLLYTSPSPRDISGSRMPSSA